MLQNKTREACLGSGCEVVRKQGRDTPWQSGKDHLRAKILKTTRFYVVFFANTPSVQSARHTNSFVFCS